MPGLIEFLRQYSLREYLSMVTLAALCGLGVAALINFSSQGVAGGQALLKTKAQIEADHSRLLTTRVSHASPARPARPHRARSRARRHSAKPRPRHKSHAPAARLVAVRTPTRAPAPRPRTESRPKPAPKPVVRAPQPAPKPAAAPKQPSSGGGEPKRTLQFDDSG
jgi:hypothetical protein